jgi:hypothetical protein
MNYYKAENERFVVDPKYDMGIGLIAIDHTQKLVRHFEVIAGRYRYITVDLYQNGLINCNLHTHGYNGCVPPPPHTKFTMNLTGGRKIGDIYIKLVEGIYRPFCERIDTSEMWVPHSNDGNKTSVPKWLGYMPNTSTPMYGRPLIYEARGSCDTNIVQQNIEHLIDQTFFTTLHTVKEMHESFSKNNGEVLQLVHTQLQHHARDIQKISEQIQELIDI